MTGREWKPGDVGVAPFALTGPLRVFRDRHGNWWDSDGEQWAHGLGDRVRPLVVIDPEDREQVERLAKAYHECDHIAPWSELHNVTRVAITDALVFALREFADPKPPRPEEPTGWGAVVEDDTGAYWTLYAPEAGVWINYREGKRRWHEINPVRIVGEGVQP